MGPQCIVVGDGYVFHLISLIVYKKWNRETSSIRRISLTLENTSDKPNIVQYLFWSGTTIHRSQDIVLRRQMENNQTVNRFRMLCLPWTCIWSLGRCIAKLKGPGYNYISILRLLKNISNNQTPHYIFLWHYCDFVQLPSKGLYEHGDVFNQGRIVNLWQDNIYFV